MSANIFEQGFLHSQGYLIAEQVFASGEIAEALSAIRTETEVRGRDKLYGAVQVIPAIEKLATSHAIADILQPHLGDNIVLTLNRHNHVSINPPGHTHSGLHRDYGEATRGILTASIALEDTDQNNGATLIVPGSHVWGGGSREVNGGYWLEDNPEYAHLEAQALPVPLQAGDVLLFNGYMYHGVGPNTSDTGRASVTLGYHSFDTLTDTIDDSKMRFIRGRVNYRGNDIGR